MEKHCIIVPEVYDWVVTKSKIHSCLSLTPCQIISERISNEFTIDESSERMTLWVADGEIPRAATIALTLEEGCGEELAVFINGNLAFTVEQGRTKVQTVESPWKVELHCLDGIGSCKGNYAISVHSLYRQFHLPEPNDRIICYLADSKGNRISSLGKNAFSWVETSSENCGEDKEFIFANGETIILQKINVCKRGFLGIEYQRKGNLCKNLIPFHVTEELFLCAPEGTRIKTEIIGFECHAILRQQESCVWIEVVIDICLSIQSEMDVTVSIEGWVCNPRAFCKGNISYTP